MDISEIKRIVKLMEAKGLTEFTMKDAKGELSLKRGNGDSQVVHSIPQVVPTPIISSPVTEPSVVDKNPDKKINNSDNDNTIEIPSPIVGTFYRKPAPDEPNFVSEGDDIGIDTVVCIVEAMKVMNEIKAEVSGTIVKVLVEDGAPVQYGQPLFLVDPS